MSATNLSQYQKDLSFNKAETFNGKTDWQRTYGYYIYPSGKKWQIRKTINGEDLYFGSFEDFHTALQVRDDLIRNGWDKRKVEYPEEYTLRKNQQEYYQHIQTQSDTRYYKVFGQSDVYLK